MGGSCSRSEHHHDSSDDGAMNPTYQEQLRRSAMTRGRWSIPNYEGSVDLDTLIAAPSPPPRKNTLRVSRDDSMVSAATGRAKKKSGRKSSDMRISLISKARDSLCDNVQLEKRGSRFQLGNIKTRKAARSIQDAHGNNPLLVDFAGKGYDHTMLSSADSIDMLDFDSDLILQSPPNTPSVIHARWGEPVEDPEQLNTCMEFVPNPFKLGFCVNCQKQHDVTSAGDVVAKKEFKKIARPTVSKTAANALENPAAIKKTTPKGGRESDVDLALLLQQRREILLRLRRMELERTQQSKRAQSRSKSVHENTEASLLQVKKIVSSPSDDAHVYNPTLFIPTRSAMSKSICAASVMHNMDGRSENVWI